MAKFKTHEDRMKHKQAQLIPATMWQDNQLFAETLDETVLSIMKAKTCEEGAARLRNSLAKINCSWKKKQAWLGIALTQPDNFQLLLETSTLLEFDDYTLFTLFAVLGNVRFIEAFSRLHNPAKALELIKDNEFYPYRKGAEHGHLEILNFIEDKASKYILEMISADDYAAYKNAARAGQVHVLKNLEAKASTIVIDMMKAQNFYAFRMGAFYGHLEVLKHLYAKAPQLFDAMVMADNYFCYRKSIEYNHPSVANWLLTNNSHCLAYAEAHMQEYGKQSVNPFINQRLVTLHAEALNCSGVGVFDIKDKEQAKICFYMVRNLIRRNERAMDDEIKFLLNIPSVKALAHTAVTSESPNELVRLALNIGNQDAAAILLNIPDVRTLTEQNDYYRAEIRGQLDLSQLCQDSESSMTALTRGEQKRLDDAIKCYGLALKKSGTNNLMNALHEQLKERYTANSASIVTREGHKIILPLDFEEFKKIQLDKKDYELALKAYYQHKDHCAWRYLSKPNPMMHPDAEYVYIDKTTSAKWSTFEDYQPLIALLWLAASDKETPPTKGHTFESRLDHFVEELALIGRSHNWDKTRINTKGKPEEYDDLEGDRPSCYSGVKRRLFQSVLGHPLITILTEDMILDEIRNFVREHFQSCIKDNTRELLKAAFEDYVLNTNDITKSNQDLLKSLNISDEKQLEFEHCLSKKYGAQYTEDFNFINIVRSKLTLSESENDFFSSCHALMLDATAGLYQMFDTIFNSKTMIKQEIINSSQIEFFSHKHPEETSHLDNTSSASSSKVEPSSSMMR